MFEPNLSQTTLGKVKVCRDKILLGTAYSIWKYNDKKMIQEKILMK